MPFALTRTEGTAPVNLLPIWGDPTDRTAYTIDLYPLSDQFAQRAVRRVLVYAPSLAKAFEIARREGLRLELGPKGGSPEHLN